MSLNGRSSQGRCPQVVGCVRFHPGSQQGLDDLGMALGGGFHQCRYSVDRNCRSRFCGRAVIGAGVNENSREPGIAVRGGFHQRRGVVEIGNIGIGAVFEQDIDQFGMAMRRGHE